MSHKSRLRFENGYAGYGYIFLDNTDKELVELIKDVDGYWYISEFLGDGIWSPGDLRLMADFIDELNELWDKEVEEGLRNA